MEIVTLQRWLKSHNQKADLSMPKVVKGRTFWVVYREWLGDRSGLQPVIACRSYEQACRIAETKGLPFVRQVTR